jgi:hypothetical protein
MLALLGTTPPAPNGIFSNAISTFITTLFSTFQVMATTLIAQVNTSIESVIPFGTVMSIIYTFIWFHVLWQAMEAFYRSIRDHHGFTMSSFLGELFESFSKIMPRFVLHVTLAMVAAAGSGLVLNVPSSQKSAFFQLAKNSGIQTAVQGFYNAYNPSSALKGACDNMGSAAGRIDYLRLRQSVKDSVVALSGRAKYEPDNMLASAAGTVTGVIAGMADKLIWLCMGPIEWLFSFVNDLVFMFAQYSVAKGIILQWVYLSISWNLAIRLLPLMILLSYFQSMRGLVIQAVTHLVTMSIAGYVVAGMATMMSDTAIWESIISTAFSTIKPDTSSVTTLAIGSMPNLFSLYGAQIANIQMGFIFMMMGKILENSYNIVQATVGGGLHSGMQVGDLSSKMTEMAGKTVKPN